MGLEQIMVCAVVGDQTFRPDTLTDINAALLDQDFHLQIVIVRSTTRREMFLRACFLFGRHVCCACARELVGVLIIWQSCVHG